jgi:hypothetical protein
LATECIASVYAAGDDHIRSGPGGDAARHERWLQRQHDIHTSAAEMLADGRLTGVDCMFNPQASRHRFKDRR